MILAGTLFVAMAGLAGAATYLFLGHYWHRVFTEKAGRPTYCNRCGIPHREGQCRR